MMVNQYNATDLANVPAKEATDQYGDGFPIPSSSGVTGSLEGATVAVSTGLHGGQKGTDSFTIVLHDDAAVPLDDVERRPKPSASGVHGNLAGATVPAAGAFDAGGIVVETDNVIDFVEAPFVTRSGHYGGGPNVDPFKSSSV